MADMTPPRDPSRDTFQMGYINQMKKNIQIIERYLARNAGSSGKPQIEIAQILEYSKVFDERLAGIAQDRHWSPTVLLLWREFKQTFRDGHAGAGSWTKSLEIVRKLDLMFRDIEA
jgi:hypothetical protein